MWLDCAWPVLVLHVFLGDALLVSLKLPLKFVLKVVLGIVLKVCLKALRKVALVNGFDDVIALVIAVNLDVVKTPT